MTDLTIADIEGLLGQYFAPWIQELGLAMTTRTKTGAQFFLPVNDRIMRRVVGGGGIVCGQAIAAAADTCSVLALAAVNDRFRNCTTVDLTTHFMRPLANTGVEIDLEVLSSGHRMAVTRATFRNEVGKLAATATCAFAYLEE